MVKYVDYKFYNESFRGTLSEDCFDQNILKASAYVRKITFGRSDECLTDENVKCATCAVCDVIAEDANRRSKYYGRNISSENIDGYSVSYTQENNSGETSEELVFRKAYKAAELYLPTDLLSLEVYI